MLVLERAGPVCMGQTNRVEWGRVASAWSKSTEWQAPAGSAEIFICQIHGVVMPDFHKRKVLDPGKDIRILGKSRSGIRQIAPLRPISPEMV